MTHIIKSGIKSPGALNVQLLQHRRDVKLKMNGPPGGESKHVKTISAVKNVMKV